MKIKQIWKRLKQLWAKLTEKPKVESPLTRKLRIITETITAAIVLLGMCLELLHFKYIVLTNMRTTAPPDVGDSIGGLFFFWPCISVALTFLGFISLGAGVGFLLKKLEANNDFTCNQLLKQRIEKLEKKND